MITLSLGNTEYPAWRHARTGESKIVHNCQEDGWLEGDWADTPAAFELAITEEAPLPIPVKHKGGRPRKEPR